jgi:hypothetical protein
MPSLHHADSLGGAELDDEIKLCELLDRGRRPRFTPAAMGTGKLLMSVSRQSAAQ